MHDDDRDAHAAEDLGRPQGEELLDGESTHDDALADSISEAPRWAQPDATGHRGVDDALAEIIQLDGLATAEHVPIYESAHRRLQDALADLDDR